MSPRPTSSPGQGPAGAGLALLAGLTAICAPGAISQQGSPGRASVPAAASATEHRESAAGDDQAAPAERAQPMPGRRPIAGLRGLDGRSTVHFAAPDIPDLQLAFTYVFPGRARLWIGSGDGTKIKRRLYYAHGEELFVIPDRSSRSIDLAAQGEVAEFEFRRDIALRQALFLFPDGHTWDPLDGEPSEDTARRVRTELGQLGSLVAETDARERCVRMTALDAAGQTIGSMKVTGHRQAWGRTWPRTIERYEPGGSLWWTETVEHLDVQVFLIDDFFLPPDRRLPEGELPTSDRPRPDDLPGAFERSLPLDVDSLEEALERAPGLRAEVGSGLGPGLNLADELVFELSESGAPSALVLRLETGPRKPESRPPGFSYRGEVPVLMLLDVAERPSPALRGRLLEQLPQGARPGAWHLRVDSADPLGKPTQVWMALQPEEA